MVVLSREQSVNGPTPFGNLPMDASRKGIPYAKSVMASDAADITSPLTGTSAVTLQIPDNAVAVIISHDSSASVSTITFNGQPGAFGISTNQHVTIPCAGESFETIGINPGSATTNVYFAFELI